MIDYISGILKTKSQESVVIECSNIGYKVLITTTAFYKLPAENSPITIYIAESVAGMYGGVINLYGFLTPEERDMYLLIKDEVPATGAKKALEYLDKVSKSFADFKTAISNKDSSMLNSVFGFTKKTADKLISALKEKIASVTVIGEEKWSNNEGNIQSNTAKEAISALMSIGYKEIQAREAVKRALKENENCSLEELIKNSLKFV